MPYRFFAVAGHRLVAGAAVSPEEVVEPDLPPMREAVERALGGAELRDERALDRVRAALSAHRLPPSTLPGGLERFEPSGVFARPPQDLPALLRLADQLESLAQVEGGERALVWKCSQCGTRYAVPVALARPVVIPCERCGTAVDLHPDHRVGEESLLDPFSGAVNTARRELADFFREAMARGYTVLVSTPGG
ncbi:MAG TPA: hypothetical protein VND93_23320 [Myxococcales bacterium]|nr:hypothetical protein [Myxococcales bacterium]